MNRSKDIEAELIALVPGLAGTGFMPAPYRVPEGYFQGFFDRLMMHIRTQESGGLKLVQPSGVSETGSEDPSVNITPAAEIEAISPLLAGLSRKTPYQVPDNYFVQFRVTEEKAVAILADFSTSMPLDIGIVDSETQKRIVGEAAETTPPAPAPVIKMNRGRSWMRIAVAAVVTAVLLTGAFVYLRSSQPTVAGDLAKVSDQDMVNYMMSEDLPVENAGDSGASQLSAAAPQPFNDYEISDLMSNVSDNELEDYASNDDGPNSNLN